MPDREDGAPFIARCTFQQPYRGGAWQCRLTDPHEGVDHDLPIDAEFGRDLDTADPLWLAAKLRDQVAKTRHAERSRAAYAARELRRAADCVSRGPETWAGARHLQSRANALEFGRG